MRWCPQPGALSWPWWASAQAGTPHAPVPAEVMQNFRSRSEVQLKVMNRLMRMSDDELGRDLSAPPTLAPGWGWPLPQVLQQAPFPLRLGSVPMRVYPLNTPVSF